MFGRPICEFLRFRGGVMRMSDF